MSKIVLNDLGTLDNFTTAKTNINANNAVIETAMDNTLSRDGTSPNQMAASVDMNSNRILNLPAPASSTEPLRSADLSSGTIQYTGGTNITVGGATISTVANPNFATSVTTPNLILAGTSLTTKTGTGSVVLATSPTLVTPILGTPTSGTLTNTTGLPVATGISGLGTGVAAFLATPSSANFATAVTGETGTGAVVFGTSPSIATPTVTGSFTATNLVTNASLAQMAANTIKANNTGGTANATDVTVPQLAAMLSVPQFFGTGAGSSTYTTPTNAKYLVVEIVGGGGGGAGSGTSPGAATSGGTSTFGSSFITCTGGTLGVAAAATSAAGGTATGGDLNLSGGTGGASTNQGNSFGGAGGTSFFGGNGTAGFGGANNATAAAANTGSGGGGAGQNATANGGGGGGAGGYSKKLITSPLASYAYTVGAAGTAGTAGTGGNAGGAGAGGILLVTAYFQ